MRTRVGELLQAFCTGEIERDKSDNGPNDRPWNNDKGKCCPKGRRGENDGDSQPRDRTGHQSRMRTAGPSRAVCADDEDYQDLRQHRFDEPSRTKLGRVSAKDQQHGKGGQIEQGDRVPIMRVNRKMPLMSQARGRTRSAIDPLEPNAHLREVVQQIVEQDLIGSSGRNGSTSEASAIDSMLPKFEFVPNAHVLQDVREGAPALCHSVGDDAEVGRQQDNVGGATRDIGSAVDRQADLGRANGRRVVDAVADASDQISRVSWRLQAAQLYSRAWEPGGSVGRNFAKTISAPHAVRSLDPFS